MKSEEKNALIAAMFQGANIKVEQFIAVNEGTVVYNDYKGGKAESVIITKGIRNESLVQVVQGLEVGDTVITTGTMQLREGQKVVLDEVKQIGN